MNFLSTLYSHIKKSITPVMTLSLAVTLYSITLSPAVAATKHQDWVPPLNAPKWSLALQRAAASDQKTPMSDSQRAVFLDISPLIESQQYQESLNLLKQRIESNEKLIQSARVLGLRGQLNMALSRFEKARSDFTQALRIDPNNKVIHQNMVSTLIELEQPSDARTHLVALLELGKVSAQLYGQLGYINLQTQHPLSAVSAYQRAFALEPENAQWSQGLLYALIQSQMTQSAASLLDELLAQSPNNSVFWLQRAQIALQQDNIERAIASIEQALSIDQNQQQNTAALLQLASLHGEYGSRERAARLVTGMQKIVDINDRDRVQRYFKTLRYITEQLIEIGSEDAINELFKQIDNDFWTAEQKSALIATKAKWYQRGGKKGSSELLYRDAIEIDPTNASAILSLANLLMQQGDIIEAQLLFQRAEVFESTQQQALLGLAQITIAQRSYETALKYLRKLYKIDPTRTELLDNIRLLEQSIKL